MSELSIYQKSIALQIKSFSLPAGLNVGDETLAMRYINIQNENKYKSFFYMLSRFMSVRFFHRFFVYKRIDIVAAVI